MTVDARRSPVLTLALVVSVLAHVALLGWLTLTPGVTPQRKPIDLVLVAKSELSQIKAPAREREPATRTGTAGTRAPGAKPPQAPAPQVANRALADAPSASTAAIQPARSLPPTMEPNPVAYSSVVPDSAAVTPPDAAAAANATAAATAGLRIAIRQRLAQFLNYPPAARRRLIEGDPVVRFVIARDGSLLHHELAMSSGSRHLDHAALKLVVDAAPYPGFPIELAVAQLEIQIPIEYRLQPEPRI